MATIATLPEGRYIGFVEMRSYKTMQEILDSPIQTGEELYWMPWTESRRAGLNFLREEASDTPVTYGARAYGDLR
jgi:hypothetical protein